MSFIGRNLLPGETVQFRTRLHWKLYVIPVLVTLLLLTPLGVLAARSQTPWLVAGPAAAAVVLLGAAWLRRRTSEFAVTNKRVILKLGVLTTRSVELLLGKVEGIAVTQSLAGRLFGFGQIVVTGSGGTEETFAGIQHPLDFRQAVQASTDRGVS